MRQITLAAGTFETPDEAGRTGPVSFGSGGAGVAGAGDRGAGHPGVSNGMDPFSPKRHQSARLKVPDISQW